ncbi:MAG: hypothetical protein QME88_09920, partial [Actinomycetota bacterium]|nr:hypothetical protein [Actinomycetota bacterium]
HRGGQVPAEFRQPGDDRGAPPAGDNLTEAGVPTPVNNRVTEIIRGIEAGRYPLSFDNLEMIEVQLSPGIGAGAIEGGEPGPAGRERPEPQRSVWEAKKEKRQYNSIFW